MNLPSSLGSRLAAGHRWVYRTHVPQGFHAPTGTWIHVRAGAFAGYGLWDDESPVALRIFSSRRQPDAEWVRARVADAWALRRQLLEKTEACRLVYGEGDGLPGVVVDYYGGYCLLLTYSSSVEGVVPWVVQALMQLAPVKGVVRRAASARERLEILAGAAPPGDLVVNEGGWRLRVDLLEGQKTGLFLDHRANRVFVAGLCRDAAVLNLFCYTGAFSLAALAGGARQVTSVDAAAPSIRAARENFSENGHDPDRFEFVVADVFEYLERARSDGRQFDVVISDPPSFAKRREQQRLALKAYRKLAVLGLRVTAPGGIYVAASCTSQVSPAEFWQTLVEAAERANRRVQLIHEAFHDIDHPVFVGHPEGRYLKCFVTRVFEPC
ncbi:MAG TPA: class I SAM-dependent rRNA methyltransferase [Polyangiaceae bacterium]|nr:class I SAM-dependent rRNA methyltransferase [Polyangiaceae bacterium]